MGINTYDLSFAASLSQNISILLYNKKFNLQQNLYQILFQVKTYLIKIKESSLGTLLVYCLVVKLNS